MCICEEEEEEEDNDDDDDDDDGQEEEALRQIARELGKTNWNFSVDPCSRTASWIQPGTDKSNNNSVICDCTTQPALYSTVHMSVVIVTSWPSICYLIGLKRQNLSGVLPPSLVRLPYLKELDLTRNYLNGTIPSVWATMSSLQTISVLGNRLSGPIPKELGNLINLTSL
ncbi:hypothetical protein ACLOJK_008660 [Asimina triloba]